MNRKELDEFVAHHRLSAVQIERVLAVGGARPGAQETAHFLTRALTVAGVLSVAAGVVFFVAANWQALHVTGRFALLQALLVTTLGLAFWRPPPQPVGRYALLAAFMLIGALLALFGQTYQTGANVYELFLTWTLLGLPPVLAGQWHALWVAWVLALNLALSLFCGLRPETGALWILFDAGWGTAGLLLIAMLVNLALWAVADLAHSLAREPSTFNAFTASSVRRLILTSAIAFATWGGVVAITGVGSYPRHADPWSVLWVFSALLAVAAYAWQRRADVFPIALCAASVILLVVFAIARNAGSDDAGFMAIALAIAAWLIISSSVAARALLALKRNWRKSGADT